MIKLDNVVKSYRKGRGGKTVQALDGISFEVAKGQVFGFLGPNGAGKSTTIKLMLNLLFPDSGKIEIGGIDVRIKKARDLIGYLPENAYFYDHLTAEELLSFGGKSSGITGRQLKQRISLLLDRVGLMDARRRPLRSYSKGMVQRAGLALALVHDPQVVILDEPMSGLDPIGRKMVGDLILQLKSEGKTVFFSSHILNDIERLCDRYGIILKGNLRTIGNTDELVSSGQSLEELLLSEVESFKPQEVV